MGTRSRAVAFFLVCVMQLGWAVAGAPSYAFDTTDQTLTQALKIYAQTTNQQIIFTEDLVTGYDAPALKGQYTAQAALERLLAGTGLTAERSPSGALMIKRPTLAVRPTADASRIYATQLAQSETQQGTAGSQTQDSTTSNQNENSVSDSSKDGDENTDNSKKAIPEILVKGTRTLNAEIRRTENDIQPYAVLDSEDIKHSGTFDLQKFLNEQMTAGTPSNSSQTGASVTGNATGFSLRGLGSAQTLILINGRRAASQHISGSSTQPDLSGIPLIAVERVEILPSTASGIFGGSATGGVINVILKQNYQGVDVSASFDNPFKATAPGRRLSMSGGFSPDGGKTNLMITGSFSEQSQLYVGERDFLRVARDHILQNNPSAIYGTAAPLLGYTTNICAAATATSTTCSPNTLLILDTGQALGSNRTFVPVGYAGATVVGDGGVAFIANAGRYNLDPANTAQSSGGGEQALINGPTTKSISTTIRRQLTDKIEAFAELAVSQNRGVFGGNANPAAYTLAGTAPMNPFQQAIRIMTPAFGLDSEILSKITSRRAVAGVSTMLGDDWHIAAEYSWSSNRFSREALTTRTTAPELAAVTAGTLDLLRDTNRYPVDFSSSALGNTVYGPVTTTLKNPAIRLGGSLPFGLPGGKPSLAMSVEYRREDLGDAYNRPPAPAASTFYPARYQSTQSVYAETRVPIVSERNRMRGLELVELQVAARHDRYTTVTANSISLTANPLPVIERRNELSSTDPTFGLRYSPVKQLTLRASYGTGFLPPNFTQLIPGADQVVPVSPLFGWTDPRRGNEAVAGNITFTLGGNPDLLPEQAESWGYGFIFTPASVPDLRISVDRTKIAKTNNISALGPQLAIGAESLIPAFVTRAAPTPQNDPNNYGVGPIVGLNGKLFNFAKQAIDAVDMVIDYHWTTSRIGEYTVSFGGTRTLANDKTVTPGATPIDSLGTLSSFKWIANAAVNWDIGKWSAGWQTHYYDGYWMQEDHAFIPNQGSATIPSQVYHDLYISYDQSATSSQKVTGFGGSLFSGLSMQFGVKNVFNAAPPVAVQDAFGYSSVGDPRLARYYFNIAKSF